MDFYMSHWSFAEHDISRYPNIIKAFMEKSIYFLKKNGYKIHLITDYSGKKRFGKLNWNSVTTELDNLNKKYSSVWSAGKVFAIHNIVKRGRPFFHIDYDFLLIKPLNSEILKKGIVTEFQYNPWGNLDLGEENDNFNHTAMDCPNYFFKECKNLYLNLLAKGRRWGEVYPTAAPYLADPRLCKKAFNCGIIGGNNLRFFEQYTAGALNMLFDKKNEYFWLTDWEIHKIFEKDFGPATKAKLLEQFYLGIAISMHGEHTRQLAQSTTLLYEAKKNKNLTQNIRLEECLENKDIFDETGYIHFLGVLPKVFFIKYIYNYEDKSQLIKSLWKKYQLGGEVTFLDHKKIDSLKWMLDVLPHTHLN